MLNVKWSYRCLGKDTGFDIRLQRSNEILKFMYSKHIHAQTPRNCIVRPTHKHI
jgi:hypothetical protein